MIENESVMPKHGTLPICQSADLAAVESPVYQGDCDRCGIELFNTTKRDCFALCQSCLEEERATTPEAIIEAKAEHNAFLMARRQWRAS